MKPTKLNPGDKVALITLAWGGANTCKDRYLQGKKQIEETFDLKVVETPNALKSEDWIYEHPEERLNDLIWAFENKDIKAIITIIGGDDTIRLLRCLKPKHLEIIKNNPKIFVGLSDTTIINLLCSKVGLTSFYGPTVLFGLAENCGIHKYTVNSFKKTLFSAKPIGTIENCKEGWTLDMVPWTKEGNKIRRKLQKPYDIQFIQGKGTVEGHLIGGCMETLEILKCTELWPDKKSWQNAILFLETSEEMPSVNMFKYWLRNYGAQGILNKLNGIILGIPGGCFEYDDPNYEKKVNAHLKTFKDFDDAIKTVAKEYDRGDLVIVTHVNFGHTCPMLTIPYGVKARIDANKKIISINESGVKENEKEGNNS